MVTEHRVFQIMVERIAPAKAFYGTPCHCIETFGKLQVWRAKYLPKVFD